MAVMGLFVVSVFRSPAPPLVSSFILRFLVRLVTAHYVAGDPSFQTFGAWSLQTFGLVATENGLSILARISARPAGQVLSRS